MSETGERTAAHTHGDDPEVAPEDSSDAPSPHRTSGRDLWKLPDYRWWFVGDSALGLGSGLRSFALPLLAFSLTGRTTASGTLATVMSATSLVASLFGGALVDRIDRRVGIQLRCWTGMVIWTVATVLLFVGHLGYAALLTVGFLSSLTGGLFFTASDAALRSLVPTRFYPQAQANNEGRNAAFSLASGPVGGLLYGITSWLPLAVPIALFGLASVSTSRIGSDLRPDSEFVEDTGTGEHADALPADPGRTEESGGTDQSARTGIRFILTRFLHDFTEGLTWVSHRHRLLSVILCTMVLNIGVSAIVYTANFHLIAIGETPWRIGLLDTAIAVSTLVGALIGPWLVRTVPTGILTIAMLAWITASLAPLIFSQSLEWILATFAIGFLASPVVNAGILSYSMSQVPTDHQGRVMTVIDFISSGASMVVPAVVGISLEHAPVEPLIVVAITFCVLGLLLALANPLLRSVPLPDKWDTCPL